MKQNRDCKIVQDLLPTYIENLTNGVTNEFIEEHIAKCPECAQVLKDMNGDLKLEKINQDYEINYLKKLKLKWVQSISIIGIVVVIIAFGVIMYINRKSQMQIRNYTFLRAETVMDDEDGENGQINVTLMAVIDEQRKCKRVRVVYKGYTTQSIREKYENYCILPQEVTNPQMIDNEIHVNLNEWNGKTIEEVKNYWQKNYEVKTIEEI